MAYADARDRIKTVLEGLSITSPADMSIKRVYADPPPTIEDDPCFVMFGPAGAFGYTAGGAAIIEGPETERARVYVHDADYGRAAALVAAFRAALIAAFKTEATLNGHAELAEVRWDHTGSSEKFTVQDFYFTFLVKVP